MNYLSVENLTKYYGDKLLFKDISFGIDKGQKVALIAKNGTGKTSMLNIINAQDIQDSGSVTLRGNIRTAYLPQIFDSSENVSILDSILDSTVPVVSCIKEYETALVMFNEKQSQENCLRMEASIVAMDNLQA